MRPSANKPIMLTLLAALLLGCAVCRPLKNEVNSSPVPVGYTSEQWKAFNDCIAEHPSDAVCDSCYKIVFNLK